MGLELVKDESTSRRFQCDWQSCKKVSGLEERKSIADP